MTLQRFAYRAAHRIVANSNAAADCLRLERVPDHRIVVIPNGVDVGLDARPRPAREPGAKRIVTTVAHLRRDKGVDVFIDAMAALARRRRDVEGWIVGDGHQRETLEARARELGAQDDIRFLGHREDVRDLLARSDVFVLASRSEASPNALLEALAAGVPSVAAAVGGVPELIEHDRTGLLVPPDDAQSLMERIALLLDKPDAAAALGDAARAATAGRSFSAMARNFERLYEEELSRVGLDRLEPVTKPLL